MIHTYLAQSDSQRRERDLVQQVERRRASAVRHASEAVLPRQRLARRRSMAARARRTITRLTRSSRTA